MPDDSWGFDHGTWGVLDLLFPGAYLPTVSMSIDMTLPPAQHFALGQALAPLRDEHVLIVGSGNVVHNLAMWRQSAGTVPDWALEFQQRINRAVVDADTDVLTGLPAGDRPADLAVNSGEHYLPLLYPCGARLPGDAVQVFNDTIDGSLSMTSYLIGQPVALGVAQ